MDDSFAFRTTVPLRRQLDPRARKAGVVVGIVAFAIGLFAHWVIASEHESFARADHGRGTPEPTVTQIGAADLLATDADAKEAARVALVAARAAFTEHRTFIDAGPAGLAELQPGYTFVDGPSTTPLIVSVATTPHVWAAASRSPTGTCFWIRATDTGSIAYGTAVDCTGAAALAAVDRGW
jgi:hypothetical protein